MGINPKSYKMIIDCANELKAPLSMVLLGSQMLRPRIRNMIGIPYKNAKKYFESLPVFSEVVCIDTNGKFECWTEDLNDRLKDMDESFDIVYNGGTLEHVAKQQEGWKNAHYLLRPGGIGIHVCPLAETGWSGHSLYLYLEEFFDELIKANKYKVVIEPEVINHKKGKAIYVAFQKVKKGVLYWKQAEPFIRKQR